MSKMFKNKNGITLVALIITVIILLILAGVSIATLTGSGLFEKARLAEQKSKNAQEKQETILGDYENKIAEYIDGNRGTVTISEEEYKRLLKSSNSNNYSTTEQVIGTWINGKPLYQKTVECSFGDNGTAMTDTVYTDNSGIYEMVMIVSAMGINSNGNTAYSNVLGGVVRTNASDPTGVYYSMAMQGIVSNGNLSLSFNHGTDRTAVKPIVTIQYTKTTDTATNN